MNIQPYQTSTITKTASILIAIITAGYMAPWAVAAVRNLTTTLSVFWVNLLLGWTVIGWVIALIMSLRKLNNEENPFAYYINNN